MTLYFLKLQNKMSFLLSCIVQWIFFGEIERNAESLQGWGGVDQRLPLGEHQVQVQGSMESYTVVSSLTIPFFKDKSI